ncbi:MAG: PEP-CTERM sorting domain-containing protein [Pirellulales bacterium]|nr:PEP-CTERM sorting domain-containing protein [Pirellulales bacterium]
MRVAARCLMVAAVLCVVASVAAADPLPGEILKFSQLPMIATPVAGPDGTQQIYYGHDELSTVWWDPTTPPDDPTYHGVFMADDFADRSPNPVVHVKWWGSYMGINPDEDLRRVQRFAIVFEDDVSKQQAIENPDDPYDFSHPNCLGPKFSQISVRDPDGQLTIAEGTFTETLVPGSNPLEPVFEYNAELLCPFAQQPDTVYWLKIVALVDEPIDDPLRLKWGWHNRDYTMMDPLASVSPQVVPGEHDQGPLFAGTSFETPIWHFQDDAVGGNVENVHVNDPCDVHMDQDHWAGTAPSMFAAMYVDGDDGPDGIGQYSKDLAFELYTVPEPSTLVLLAMGAFGLLLGRRR